ncbi:MAG: SMP-30/Gluconolaconase/LRE-like region family protein [Patescibacteria group bacterium]|nr:SMP-30/Gluconolaconase/LRE-like region family protein [Patescibacteria group bacterium]
MRQKKIRTIMGVGLILVGIAASAPGTSKAIAAPSVQIIAGTGVDGFSGDGGPAASAQLFAPAAVSTDAAGNVYVMDRGNRRVRQIDTQNKMHTAVGDGSSCGNVTDPALPLTGMCPVGGLALAPDGSSYFSQNGAIVRVAPDGLMYHYAGKYTGFFGPYDDGPKYGVSFSPTAVAYDDTTGNVLFAEQRAIRAVTPAGQIVTVAGKITPGDSGACNSPSDDVTPALGSCFYPRGLAAKNGKIYFTEQSSWNGPRARVIDGGTVRTIAGNGSRIDPADGAAATASGFSDMGGIAVDNTGNVYLSGLSRGQVWKVSAADQTITKVTEFEGGAGWLATDAGGNLYVSLQYKHSIAKISGLQPPKPLPMIADIAPDAPSSQDPLLTRGVTITPSDNGVPSSHFEYGWASSSTATEPSAPLQRSDTTQARLRYHDTTPDQDWYLLARGFNAAGEAGPWSTPHLVHTPKAPSLIILGDSISSGHHNGYGDNGKTKCDDENYGYAFEFSNKWRAELPVAWRQSGNYHNFAHSGFATQKRANLNIKGSVIDGGTNACQEGVITKPLADAKDILGGSDSWNRIVISAGIDDTNWDSAVRQVIGVQVASDIASQFITSFLHLPGVNISPMKEDACRALIKGAWNGRTASVQSSITSGASQITSGLHSTDPTAKITWLGYYNIAGTGTNELRSTPYFPEGCSNPVSESMVVVHNAIRSGLPADVHFVSADPVMHQDNSKIQPLYLGQAIANGNGPNPAGWPHPNRDGAQAIATLLIP